MNTASTDQRVAIGYTCLCCGSSTAIVFLSDCRDHYMGCEGTFDYYRCQSCGVVQLHPIPDDMGPYYRGYQVHTHKSSLHELARTLLMRGGYYFPPAGRDGPLRILDFGCGDGWYLRQVRERGHTAIGFEKDPGYAQKLSAELGLPIYSDLARLLDQHRESLDLVTMHFVVEHLSQLHDAFAAVHTLLKRGGTFYFTIPNIDSIDFRIFGKKWHGLDAPRHISFLNDSAIRSLALERNFQVEEIDDYGLPSDTAGSLSTVMAGRYHYALFCSLIPLATAWAYSFSQGNLRVRLSKAKN